MRNMCVGAWHIRNCDGIHSLSCTVCRQGSTSPGAGRFSKDPGGGCLSDKDAAGAVLPHHTQCTLHVSNTTHASPGAARFSNDSGGGCLNDIDTAAAVLLFTHNTRSTHTTHNTRLTGRGALLKGFGRRLPERHRRSGRLRVLRRVARVVVAHRGVARAGVLRVRVSGVCRKSWCLVFGVWCVRKLEAFWVSVMW